MPDQKKSPIQLETLLKVKRYEKPDAVFWANFDRELDSKRLKTLIKKESIIHRWSQSLLKRAYRLIPASGVAVLIIASCFRFITAVPVLRVCSSDEATLHPTAFLKDTANTCAQNIIQPDFCYQNPVKTAINIPHRSHVEYTVASIAHLPASQKFF